MERKRQSQYLLLNIASLIRASITKVIRGGSRAAATSKMERFVIIANGFQPLTIITKHSILDFATPLDLLLVTKTILKLKARLNKFNKAYAIRSYDITIVESIVFK